jgi:ABC-2 type transport system ATP-binding protein
MSNAIETENLTKMFGDFTAVDSININVREGTINGFIGPNGAGKTTTMKMLIGALNPTKGAGTIRGHPIGSMQAKKLVGFSPEHPKFYGNMKAQKYLVFMGMVCGMGRGDAETRSMDLLKWLGIQSFSDKKIQGFSAGMKQKLSLAQALIHDPEILILDEPTANLDPAGRYSIIENLKQLCQESHTTVFISSHILSELEKIVTEVTMINHGKLVAGSEVKTLQKEVSGDRYVIKTSDNHKLLEMIKDREYIKNIELDGNGILHITSVGDETSFRRNITRDILTSDLWLEKFNIETSNLEGVFMKLVGEGEEDQRITQEKKHNYNFLRRFGK